LNTASGGCGGRGGGRKRSTAAMNSAVDIRKIPEGQGNRFLYSTTGTDSHPSGKRLAMVSLGVPVRFISRSARITVAHAAITITTPNRATLIIEP
jgi:hypothetical protein